MQRGIPRAVGLALAGAAVLSGCAGSAGHPAARPSDRPTEIANPVAQSGTLTSAPTVPAFTVSAPAPVASPTGPAVVPLVSSPPVSPLKARTAPDVFVSSSVPLTAAAIASVVKATGATATLEVSIGRVTLGQGQTLAVGINPPPSGPSPRPAPPSPTRCGRRWPTADRGGPHRGVGPGRSARPDDGGRRSGAPAGCIARRNAHGLGCSDPAGHHPAGHNLDRHHREHCGLHRDPHHDPLRAGAHAVAAHADRPGGREFPRRRTRHHGTTGRRSRGRQPL